MSPSQGAGPPVHSKVPPDPRREVNNLFGEGTSAKMRLIRMGLDALGLESNSFLRHNSRRIIYGVPLCSNNDSVALRMADDYEYLLPHGELGTTMLVNYWRERWLTSRIDRPEILEDVRGSEFESYRLGRETESLASSSHGSGLRRAGRVGADDDSPLLARSEDAGEQTFIERLYRSNNSYADRLSQDEIESIHVDLGVDSYILDQAGRGRQIVVTGNPGDGKTHLIERLRAQLIGLNARVITDANALTDQEILGQWQASCHDGRPFVLAINEWPLFVLQRLASANKFTPVAEALRQATTARCFLDSHRPEEVIAVQTHCPWTSTATVQYCGLLLRTSESSPRWIPGSRSHAPSE